VELALTAHGKIVAKEAGELIFTHYGISGPIVLNMSRLIIDYVSNKRHCEEQDPSLVIARPIGAKQSHSLGAGSAISHFPHKIEIATLAACGDIARNDKPRMETEVFINFFPGNDVEKLKALLSKRWQAHPQKTLANSLIGLLPKKLCDVLTTELKLADKQVNQITKKESEFIAERLIRWPITIKKPRSFDDSMVTAGGVAMDEVNTRTMESLKAKGLYLAGEILDIDGVSGGYNLQFAWSTGYIAGLQGAATNNI
jgi:predicted flavoprotein YhiN